MNGAQRWPMITARGQRTPRFRRYQPVLAASMPGRASLTELSITMSIRTATLDDAVGITAIYAPIVRETVISFELEAPTVDAMRARIVSTLERLPWLVSVDENGKVDGYVYASKHRERAAYQWSVDVTAYVRSDSRGRGIGKGLYKALFKELKALGYTQAFAGIALPNIASVALHESIGFEPIGVYRKVGFKLDTWHDVGWWQCAIQELAQPYPPKIYQSSRS